MKFNIKSPPFLSCTQKVPKVQPFTSDNEMLPGAAVKQNKDMAYQEYADIHGISSAAVNNMRNKAVAKLRASLEELAESNEKKKLRKK